MSNEIDTIRTIFIFTYPFTGHCNPIFGICRRLTQQSTQQVKLVVYGAEKFKRLFEECGAEFRTYKTSVSTENVSTNFNPILLILQGLYVANKNAKEIYRQVLEAKVDLILYDKSALYPKFMIEYFIQKIRQAQIKMFKIIGYSTTLQMDRYYPNEFELKLTNIRIQLRTVPRMIKYLKSKRHFIRKHSLQHQSYSILANFDQLDNETSIVFTFPQLQPRAHLRDTQRFKFVGCSFDENYHFNGLNDRNEKETKLKEFLDEFPIRGEELTNKKFDLIYVSLGTIFNTDPIIFNTILKSIELVGTKRPLKAIISTGEKCYDILKQYETEKILLLKTAPQIEILQQASLFLTHCGMNSTSEAIHFGVPMICLPMALGIDQPLVAYRVADELGMGIRLSAKDLRCVDLKVAILKVLEDEGYAERAQIYKEISRRYDGLENTSKIVLDILKD